MSNVMNRDEQQLEEVWLDLEPVADDAPAVDPNHLVHARQDSSILFSTATFRVLALTGMRPPQPPAVPLAASAALADDDDASDTFVPIAVSGTPLSARDAWLWRSLTVATATLLFAFVVALNLLVGGH
jgi:hypothetical protein